MTLCMSGCGREAVVASPFCHGCSAAVAWRASGRTDVAMPERIAPTDRVVASAFEGDAPNIASTSTRPKKTTTKAKK